MSNLKTKRTLSYSEFKMLFIIILALFLCRSAFAQGEEKKPEAGLVITSTLLEPRFFWKENIA